MRAKKAITQKGEAGRKSTNPGQPEFGQPAKPQCLIFTFTMLDWFLYIFFKADILYLRESDIAQILLFL